MRNYILGIALLLTACAGTVVVPQTTDQKFYAADSALVAAKKQAVDLAVTGRITVTQAKEIASQIDEQRAILKVARAAIGTSAEKDSIAQLQAVQSVLLAIQQQLLKSGGAP